MGQPTTDTKTNTKTETQTETYTETKTDTMIDTKTDTMIDTSTDTRTNMKTAVPQGRRLSRNVWITGFVSLFTDISSEMIVPVLPLFLSSALGAPMSAIGVIEGFAEAIASIMKGISGYISDRMGRRKPLMALGYGLSNILKPMMGFAGSWGQILVIRLSDRFGKGLRAAPRDALIAESAGPDMRGKAYGLHHTMDKMGAVIGPLSAWMILQLRTDDYRMVFWWSVLPGVVSILLLILFLRDTQPEKRAEPGPVLRNWSLALGALPGRLRTFILISTLFAVGNSSNAFLLLKAQDMGLAAALVPIAYLTFNVVDALFSYPLGMLSDRVGRKPFLVGGFSVFAVIYAGFAVADAAWMAWPLFAAYGLYYAGTAGIQRAYIADLAPGAVRGTALGVFNALTGLAALPASLLAGVLWQQWSPAAPFWVGAATAGVSAVLLLIRG